MQFILIKQQLLTGLFICSFILQVFSQEQVVYDNSIGNNHGYLGSNENYEDSDPWQVEGKFGKALDFNGKDDFVLIPDSDHSSIDISGGPLTISAWVNPDTHSASGKTRSIAGKGNTQYKLGQNKDGWEFSIFDNDGFHTIQSMEKPETGKWTHLVGRFDPESDGVTLWVNGEKQNNTGVSGGAEPGAFMNLETPVANPHSGETVSVGDYGAVPDDGNDDTDAIQQAFNSGKNVMFPDGVYDISANLNINNADMADKTIFAENNLGATLKASGKAIYCHFFYNIKGLIFKKIELIVYGGDNKNHPRFIQNNKFEKPYQNGGPAIKTLKDEKVENLIINKNSFYGGSFAFKVGHDGGKGTLKNSYIEDNYSEGVRRHYNFRTGVENVYIRNNVLQGEEKVVPHEGITHKDAVGIGFFLFLYHTPVKNIIIENNELYDISEEGISFDPFGRDNTSYTRWNGHITDYESTNGEVTRLYLNSIPGTNEWSGGNGYINYSVVFYEDNSTLKGKSAMIHDAGENGQGAYIDVRGIDENLMYDNPNCLILAQIPRNILIRNNHCERIGRTGILFSAGFNRIVENNTLIECNLEIGDADHEKRWGGITLKTLNGLGPPPGDHSPVFYNTVIGNTLNGDGTDLTIYTHSFGNYVFGGIGNTQMNNTFLNGAISIFDDTEEPCAPASNFSDVAIGYNDQTRGGYFDGKIDDVQIYRRALSDEEVTKLANGEDIGDTFLFGSWKFDSLLQSMPSSVEKIINDNKAFSIYPNPASGKLNLKLNSTRSNKHLEIFDMQGNKMKKMELSNISKHNEIYQIDISNMKPGLYLLHVKSGQKSLTGRFQVVH